MKGCRASYDAVRRHVNRKIGSPGRPGWWSGPAKVAVPPSARELSFAFIARPKDWPLSDDLSEAAALLDRLRK